MAAEAEAARCPPDARPRSPVGCSTAGPPGTVWPCRGHSVCADPSSQHVLYGWAKDAPPAGVPAGAAFRVGDGTGSSSLVMQVHFTTRRPPGDRSGVRLHLEAGGGGGGGAGGGGGGEAGAAFSAGLTMFARYFQIPPREPEVKVPNQCCLRGFEPQHAFAFRVHAHDMGRYENSSFISFCAVF
jgi:peptidylamidoglycolate lyase